MDESEIYKPDLDKIPRLTAKVPDHDEIVNYVETFPLKGKELLWVIYGLILKHGGQLEKLIPAMKAKSLPGWFIFVVGGVAKLIGWQAKRLEQ